MFDIGFWELTIIAVVALIVIGPERLPRVARTVGMWVGRGQKILSSVKEDIDRELKAEELKKVLAKQGEVTELHDLADEFKKDVVEQGEISELSDLNDELKQDVAESAQTKKSPESDKVDKAES